MEKKKVKDLAKGEYFILNPIEEPNASQVWVRGEYIREAKKYSTYNGKTLIMKLSGKETRKFT